MTSIDSTGLWTMSDETARRTGWTNCLLIRAEYNTPKFSLCLWLVTESSKILRQVLLRYNEVQTYLSYMNLSLTHVRDVDCDLISVHYHMETNKQYLLFWKSSMSNWRTLSFLWRRRNSKNRMWITIQPTAWTFYGSGRVTNKKLLRMLLSFNKTSGPCVALSAVSTVLPRFNFQIGRRR